MHFQVQAGSVCGLVVAVGALSALGCAPTTPREGLRSQNPLDRTLAIVAVAEGGDVEAVHKLVDLLEDPEPAVRFYAIMALRRMCGEDYGYQYYAAVDVRAAAVARWRAALRAGEVTVRWGGAGAGRGRAGEPTAASAGGGP